MAKKKSMTEKTENPIDMTAMVNTWMTSIGKIWEQAIHQWEPMASPKPDPSNEQSESGNGGQSKAQKSMAAALKNWQTMANAIATPESMKALLKGSEAMPEILLKLSHSSTSSFLEMQQKILQRINTVGASTEAYRYDNIDENLFRIWSDIYEKEFRKFFNIPQLGLLRTYQEKANQMADKYNLFQAQLSEFLRLLGLPFNHTLQLMQEELSVMASKGELPEDPQIYYQMWVRMLEGHFMTLFQTTEYVESLGRTISSLADFSASRDAVLEDILSTLPVARKTELDDMARDLYELKKRLRKLEKEQKQPSSNRE